MPVPVDDPVSGMKTPGRRLYDTLDRAAEWKGIKKALGRIVRVTSHAVIAGGTAVMVIGMFGLSLELTLIGVSLLVPGIFFRTMMGTTKDIGERLFEGQDKLLEGQDKLLEGQDKLLEGQDKLLEGQDKLLEGQGRIEAKLGEVIESIRGPPRLDEEGNPVKPDYAKENLMAKMDELIAAVNRLADRRP